MEDVAPRYRPEAFLHTSAGRTGPQRIPARDPRLPVALLACLLLLAVLAHADQSMAVPNSLASLSESQASYRTGMTLVHQNRLEEAIAAFQLGLQANPRDYILLDALGAAYSLEGKFDKASGCFLDSLAITPGFMPAEKNLAISYFNLHQYDLSAAEFAKLKALPGSPTPTINLFLGMIAEKTGDYAGALLLSEKAGQSLYKYPEALLGFSNAAIHMKQPQRAQRALLALNSLPGVTASQYMRAGEMYRSMGQNAHALNSFNKADALDHDVDGLEYARAALLDQMNRPREALVILQDLTAAKPDSQSLNLLAHVAEKNREFSLAAQSLRRAAKLDPDREENYLDFATLCADYGNYSLSLQATDAGLAHIPDSYRLMVQKGVVLENLGRIDEAEAILQSASGLQKDNSVARLSLAIVQAHSNQLHESEGTLTAALRDFPDNYYMHYQLGKVLVQLQQAGEDSPAAEAKAKEAFTRATQFNPSFADSYFQLAKLSLHTAPSLAERNLLTCLRLDPDHGPAEYMLARLYMATGRRTAGQAMIDRFEKLQKTAKLKEQQEPRISPAKN